LDRLRLYARLNHCLRSWVTACDNLLDNELKEMIITDLPENARTFKSVHTLLVTDRIFFSFLMDAVHAKIISEKEMMRLLAVSLSSISASGREEAEEEEGIDHTLPPEDVLNKIHSAKTGRLFISPLCAPAALHDINSEDPQVAGVREGLMAFGLGCQVLDDLSDLGMDLYDNKYNYLAALIVHGNDMKEKELLLALASKGLTPGIRNDFQLYQKFPHASKNAMDMAVSQLHRALTHLSQSGLPLTAINRESFIKVLIKVFRHPNRLLNIRER
jgi:geranylgeranyl pyrophosphate synthase